MANFAIHICVVCQKLVLQADRLAQVYARLTQHAVQLKRGLHRRAEPLQGTQINDDNNNNNISNNNDNDNNNIKFAFQLMMSWLQIGPSTRWVSPKTGPIERAVWSRAQISEKSSAVWTMGLLNVALEQPAAQQTVCVTA